MAHPDPCSEMESFSKRLEEELELLRCVCLEDVIINYKEDEHSGEIDHIYMTVYPATAGKAEEQFVCAHIHITLPNEYPDKKPEFKLKNPRGLSEQELIKLESSVNSLVEEQQGNPVLLQMFDLVRSTLSDSNVPHGVCSICLTDFLDEVVPYIKTECYHYFHKTCIHQYRRHWLASQMEKETQHLPAYQQVEAEKLSCPECRKPIQLPDESACAADYKEETFTFVPDETLRKQQKKWQQLYEKQKSQGGIIDIEAEKQKYRMPPSVNSDDNNASPDSTDTGQASRSDSHNSELSSLNRIGDQTKNQDLNSKHKQSAHQHVGPQQRRQQGYHQQRDHQNQGQHPGHQHNEGYHQQRHHQKHQGHYQQNQGQCHQELHQEHQGHHHQRANHRHGRHHHHRGRGRPRTGESAPNITAGQMNSTDKITFPADAKSAENKSTGKLKPHTDVTAAIQQKGDLSPEKLPPGECSSADTCSHTGDSIANSDELVRGHGRPTSSKTGSGYRHFHVRGRSSHNSRITSSRPSDKTVGQNPEHSGYTDHHQRPTNAYREHNKERDGVPHTGGQHRRRNRPDREKNPPLDSSNRSHANLGAL